MKNSEMEGTVWAHVKKKAQYYILRVGKMENPATQKWEECVVYCRDDQTTADIYVRSIKRFKERFKRRDAPVHIDEAEKETDGRTKPTEG